MPKNGPLNQLYSNHVLYCTCSNLQFEYSAGSIALRVEIIYIMHVHKLALHRSFMHIDLWKCAYPKAMQLN